MINYSIKCITILFSSVLMSKVCQVTGKKAMVGNHVSHAKNRVKRLFKPNLHKLKFSPEFCQCVRVARIGQLAQPAPVL